MPHVGGTYFSACPPFFLRAVFAVFLGSDVRGEGRRRPSPGLKNSGQTLFSGQAQVRVDPGRGDCPLKPNILTLFTMILSNSDSGGLTVVNPAVLPGLSFAPQDAFGQEMRALIT